MSLNRSITWLGKQKEKKALSLFEKHINQIVETSKLMKETISKFCEKSENIKADSDQVFDKEKDADETKSQILTELSKGNFPPMSREKIMRLVTTADDIADNARAAAMKLSLLEAENIDEDLRKDLGKLSEYAYESTRLLKKAFETLLEDPESAIEETEKVEEMEEKIDFFRAENLTPKIIRWADESHKPGSSHVLTEVEDNIEEVADQAENCADAIREIAIGEM